jgi:hypothetical protein
MTENEKKPIPESGDTRKRYEKPRILYREPLEAVAAACTPPGKAVVEQCAFASS